MSVRRMPGSTDRDFDLWLVRALVAQRINDRQGQRLDGRHNGCATGLGAGRSYRRVRAQQWHGIAHCRNQGEFLDRLGGWPLLLEFV